MESLNIYYGVLDYSSVIRSSIEVQKTLITLFPDVLTKEDIQNLVHNKDDKSGSCGDLEVGCSDPGLLWEVRDLILFRFLFDSIPGF